jgi:putative protein-disulfide isomerase
MNGPHLVYFADPMCSWCWGFSPVISAIGERFGKALPIRLVMGGLRPGTIKPMDEASKVSMRSHWEHVHQASGQPFDFDFFERETFVYDTEPASRAVVVTRRRSMHDGLAALRRIQAAFYGENRDVTAAATLTKIAGELGFEAAQFRAEFDAAAALNETQSDFALSRNAGITGFPTLIEGDRYLRKEPVRIRSPHPQTRRKDRMNPKESRRGHNPKTYRNSRQAISRKRSRIDRIARRPPIPMLLQSFSWVICCARSRSNSCAPVLSPLTIERAHLKRKVMRA